METTKLKAETFIPLSKELKEKREMMGLRQTQICTPLSINKGNYSKMESGLADPTNALQKVRRMFNVWIKERLDYHKNEIKRLEKLIVPIVIISAWLGSIGSVATYLMFELCL